MKRMATEKRTVNSEKVSRKKCVSVKSTKTERGPSQRTGKKRQVCASLRSQREKLEDWFGESEDSRGQLQKGNFKQAPKLNFKKDKAPVTKGQHQTQVKEKIAHKDSPNERDSATDSRLNYTQTVLHLTESNVSLLESRNKKYNVFNTYCAVRNPKNIMTRKDRTEALRDLVQRDSTCSSGHDITILKSTHSGTLS